MIGEVEVSDLKLFFDVSLSVYVQLTPFDLV